MPSVRRPPPVSWWCRRRQRRDAEHRLRRAVSDRPGLVAGREGYPPLPTRRAPRSTQVIVGAFKPISVEDRLDQEEARAVPSFLFAANWIVLLIFQRVKKNPGFWMGSSSMIQGPTSAFPRDHCRPTETVAQAWFRATCHMTSDLEGTDLGGNSHRTSSQPESTPRYREIPRLPTAAPDPG